MTDAPPPPPPPAEEPPPPAREPQNPLRSSRTSNAWIGVVVSIVLLVLLVVFVVQNTESAPIEFLWIDGRAPLAVMLLVATAAGMAIATTVGSLRILQLRRRVRRERA